MDKPLLGHGYNSFETYYMIYQAEYFRKNPESKYILLADNVKHPFNEGLLIMAEFGITGFVLAALLLVVIFRLYLKNKSRKSFSLISALFALLLFSFFSYPFNYPFSWLTLCFCTAGLCVLRKNTREVFVKHQLIVKSTVVFISVVLTVWLCRDIYFENKWYVTARKSLLGQATKTIPEYERLYPYMRRKPLFLYNYAAELYYANHHERSNQLLYECETAFNDYDIQMLLGNNFIGMSNNAEAEKYLQIASYMCPNRFKPLYELVKIYEKTNQTDKLNETAEIILNKRIKVPSSEIIQIKQDVEKILRK